MTTTVRHFLGVKKGEERKNETVDGIVPGTGRGETVLARTNHDSILYHITVGFRVQVIFAIES